MCKPDDFPPYPIDVNEPDEFPPDPSDLGVDIEAPGFWSHVPYRALDPDEERRFRQWARDNYKPGSYINPLWHPVVRSECNRMEREEYGS